MITAIITALIYIVLLAIVVYIIIWVIGVIGLAIPPKIIQLIWVVFALVVLLILVQLFLGGGIPHLGRLAVPPLMLHA